MRNQQSVQGAFDLWSLHDYEEHEASFSPVAVDELILALNLFVSAAGRQRFSTQAAHATDAQSLQRAAKLFHKLAGDAAPAKGNDATPVTHGQVTLESAFDTLWCHYRLHTLQESICARVLGFYLMMERTRGAALTDWIELCPSEPRSVMLHPAIVEALAVVPMDSSGLISAALLIATAEGLGRPGLAN